MPRVLFAALVVGWMCLSPVTAGKVIWTGGEGVEAYFFSVDQQGIETRVWVHANVYREKTPPEGRFVTSLFLMNVTRFDSVNNVLLFEGLSEKHDLLPEEFQIDRNLNHATIDLTTQLGDLLTQTTQVVTVNLEFTAISRPTKRNSQYHIHAPDYLINTHGAGMMREPQVTGTVIVGGENLTPEEPYDAYLAQSKHFEVSIDK